MAVTTSGERLRESRNARRLSQVELGKLVGITQVSVSRYERDAHAMNAEIARDIAAVLRVSPGWLIFGEGQGPAKSAKAKRRAA